MHRDDDIRRDIRDAASTTSYAVRKFIFPVVIVVVVAVVLGFILEATGIIHVGIQREVVKHSLQYTEGKSGFVTQLINEYYELGTGIAEARAAELPEVVKAKEAQRKAVLQNIHRQGELIPSYQRPEDIQKFLDEHPLS